MSDKIYDDGIVKGAMTHDGRPAATGFEHPFNFPYDKKFEDFVTVLMHDGVVPIPKLKIEDVDWDDEKERQEMVDYHNKWLTIHMRQPVAVFTTEEEYDNWRAKYLGDGEMPENWHTVMQVPIDNGPAMFEDQTPCVGTVGSMEEGIESTIALLKLQEEKQ
tara:strand:- start:983 stop:1465 length:483 start_codon:yes stop_codon:yes gene_type:complete